MGTLALSLLEVLLLFYKSALFCVIIFIRVRVRVSFMFRGHIESVSVVMNYSVQSVAVVMGYSLFHQCWLMARHY